MCFSPEVDLLTGVVIAGIGVDTLRHVKHESERPLAALPLIFGTHQMVEAVVWWGIDGYVDDRTTNWFAMLYLAIAFGLIPWFVPWAAQRIEPDRLRRRLMLALTVLGASVSVYLMVPVVRGPILVADGGFYLAYSVPLAFGVLATMLYVAATCGSLLLSSDRRLVQFGAINAIAVTALAVLLMSGVISLWCIWAAITSGAVALHLRRAERRTHRRKPAPAFRSL